MTDLLQDYLFNHIIETLAALLGILSVLFQIRQNILIWLFGIVAALLYAWVFFESKLYALMSLQGYYVAVSIYGWWMWIKKEKNNDTAIRRVERKDAIYLTFAGVLLTAGLYVFLRHFTDSVAPLADAFLTAASLVASYMLAHKYLEQWLLWLVVDVLAVILYWQQALYSTVVFSAVLSVMAVIGFNQWYKQWRLSEK